MGYGRSEDPNMDKVYVSIQVAPIDKMNSDPVEEAIRIAESTKGYKPNEEEKPLAQFESMVREFNKNNPGKRVTVGKLEEVFARGIQVFREQNMRGNENAFAMGLVSRFLENYAKKKAESYTDYPQAATNNAKRALKWAEENGWGSCGTDVGKARARQLANREPISRDTIARMASFKRHQQHADVPYTEGCGGLMWDAWGGSAGVEWAIKKLQEIENR
jgi:hypothetical protein